MFNRPLTKVERFKKQVESVKDHIVSLSKEYERLDKSLNKAYNEEDRKAVEERGIETVKRLNKHRLLLDDLTYAFINAQKPGYEKLLRTLKFQTRDGFLRTYRDQDRDYLSLETMMEVVMRYPLSLDEFYSYEAVNGERQIKRNTSSFSNHEERPNYTGKDLQTIYDGVESGSKHR